jgi:hypothetical protein
VPVAGGVAGGTLPMSAGSSFHRRRNPNGSAFHRRIMAGVQDATKHAISATCCAPLCPRRDKDQNEASGKISSSIPSRHAIAECSGSPPLAPRRTCAMRRLRDHLNVIGVLRKFALHSASKVQAVFQPGRALCCRPGHIRRPRIGSASDEKAYAVGSRVFGIHVDDCRLCGRSHVDGAGDRRFEVVVQSTLPEWNDQSRTIGRFRSGPGQPAFR